MMKISHFLRSRGALSEKLLSGKVNNNGSALFTQGITSQSGTSLGRSGNQPVNIFADFTVYKGKGALSMNPIMPKFSLLESGGFRVDKKGVVLLTFLPAIGERKYDWQKRQLFALSATELGSLISLEPGKSCEFFHDPSMKTSNAGQIRKSLSVTPFSDETGYMFNLSVVNGVLKTNERLSVPLTKAEFTVIRTACSYILPHIMGWDQYPNQLPGSTETYPLMRAEKRVSMKDEWDR